MRSTWKIGIAVATGMLLVPQVALSGDVEEQLRSMNERLTTMEQRLQATDDELSSARRTVEAQRDALEEAGIEQDEGSALSALSAFLESTDFSGWVAASYTYNINDDGNDRLKGQNSGLITAPFHADANAFKMNQAWFEIDKDVNEESRGGFHVDLLFGSDAEVLGDKSGSSGGNDGVEVFTAYASYLAPIGPGIRVDAGELPTLLGAEVVQSPYNFNITRGLLWSIQPVTHTGAISSVTMENGFGAAAGFVNAPFKDANFDTDDDKAFTGQLSYGEEGYSAAVSAIYGSPLRPRGRNGDDVGMVDFLLTADPTDTLSIWFNFDWGFKRDTPGVKNSDVWGGAVAARLEVLDGTGVALRYEYMKDSDGFLTGVSSVDTQLQSLTATIDHELAEGLMVRLEGRFDWADLDDASDNVFRDANGKLDSDNQQLLLAEMIYQF